MTDRLSDPAAVLTAIGVISGTSMDAIDVSLVTSDGRGRPSFGTGAAYPYRDETRRALQAVIADAERLCREPLTELEAAVTADHLAAIRAYGADQGLDLSAIDLVGLHGQTIYHRPQQRFTRQLIDGPAVADALGLPVVDRFRDADVAAGGEGAPFAPLYHRALAQGLEQPLMVLNLGGVGNVSYIDGDSVIAFDTGPASAILDDFMLRRLGRAYDADGALAASGRVHEDLVAGFMANPFFDRPAPKSLDRNDFHRRAQVVEPLSDADGAATLAAFTVESLVAALRHVPSQPKRWLVGGGGRLNRHFMARLAARLRVPVEPVEAAGWDGDALEAQIFAYFAIRSVKGLPLSLPATTGVSRPMTGGRLSLPAGRASVI
ncbi:anhydro-N-acetylmuramic acid kinase [Bosea sp. (in: a-proteobacteria)]|uniref:anhydro-N-acetylmuramic acid kinase n=1 Tax=Bosea sp. (in: a-proteobacteria) TaxID=1871050 RepID=UPI002621C50E|nr:anhydro-N-acetylmuramic acid kinase [Bosea sp. (in: a-proteobacteria)]MCO5091646.1 anhydro-N-acetylmuramic acid kinase [Bosea sp. (in: a-proteobacteria)]